MNLTKLNIKGLKAMYQVGIQIHAYIMEHWLVGCIVCVASAVTTTIEELFVGFIFDRFLR